MLFRSATIHNPSQSKSKAYRSNTHGRVLSIEGTMPVLRETWPLSRLQFCFVPQDSEESYVWGGLLTAPTTVPQAVSKSESTEHQCRFGCWSTVRTSRASDSLLHQSRLPERLADMTGSDAQLAFILNESIILTTTFDRFR